MQRPKGTITTKIILLDQVRHKRASQILIKSPDSTVPVNMVLVNMVLVKMAVVNMVMTLP